MVFVVGFALANGSSGRPASRLTGELPVGPEATGSPQPSRSPEVLREPTEDPVIASATPDASASPASPDSPAPSATAAPPLVMQKTSTVAESSGIRLTLTLTRPKEYTSGQRIDADLRIQNVGQETVRAKGSSSDDLCSQAATLTASAPALASRGRRWPDRWGELKEQILTSFGEPTLNFFDERTERSGQYGCPAIGRAPYEWPPGTDVTIHRFWNGRVVHGDGAVDLPPGPVAVRAEFPAVVREDSESSRNDIDGWKPSPVSVSSDIEIRVGAKDIVGAGEAVDQALENDRVHGWMQARMEPEIPEGSVLIDGDGPNYPKSPKSVFWRMEATHWTDEDHFDAIWVDVDMVTGEVLQITQRDKIQNA